MTDAPLTDLNVASPGETAMRVRLRRFMGVIERLASNPTTVIGLVIIGLMLAMAIFAPLITQANTPAPYQMPRDWGAVRKPPGTPARLPRC